MALIALSVFKFIKFVLISTFKIVFYDIIFYLYFLIFPNICLVEIDRLGAIASGNTISCRNVHFSELIYLEMSSKWPFRYHFFPHEVG